MREFKKSTSLDNVRYEVRGPLLDEAERMIARGQDVITLDIGNPAPFGFSAPQVLLDKLKEDLSSTQGYSASKGTAEAREAILAYAKSKGLPHVSADNIFTGNGVSELISIALTALLTPGDEVLIPAPDYPLWTSCTTLSGGKAVHYLCDEQNNWYPDMDDLRSKITARTKALVIINPNNPTGVIYPEPVLQQLVDLARGHGLMILSDEIYDRLLMPGQEHISIASLAPDLFCITFSGLSKSHFLTGFRVGWMVFSGAVELGRDFIDGVNTLLSMRLCSNTPGQSVVPMALGSTLASTANYYVPGGRLYEQVEYATRALNSIDGITAVEPQGAFYIFPRIDMQRFDFGSDEQFAMGLLRDKNVLVVSGTGFNWIRPDHFRVVCLPEIPTLKRALDALAAFMDAHRV